ncbi:WG repeat-containing protein [Nonlabens xiamenensis]|uniref:WG repeat-containing protein n=1 Tax=Nonlabens xiamenensis TaxID=2341043 RepID=UPI0013DE5AD6|nr:WG repeat-containing protein [Nonlabens xiamenensis]
MKNLFIFILIVCSNALYAQGPVNCAEKFNMPVIPHVNECEAAAAGDSGILQGYLECVCEQQKKSAAGNTLQAQLARKVKAFTDRRADAYNETIFQRGDDDDLTYYTNYLNAFKKAEYKLTSFGLDIDCSEIRSLKKRLITEYGLVKIGPDAECEALQRDIDLYRKKQQFAQEQLDRLNKKKNVAQIGYSNSDDTGAATIASLKKSKGELEEIAAQMRRDGRTNTQAYRDIQKSIQQSNEALIYDKQMSQTTYSRSSQLNQIRERDRQGQERLRAANAAIDDLASLFMPKQRDRSGEAIIKDHSRRSKAIVADWKREFNAKKEELAELKKQRMTSFEEIISDTANALVLEEAFKHYRYGDCPNPNCKNGKIHEHRVELCSSCEGATFYRVGVFIAQGQTKHPNDGKKLCTVCDASGVVEKHVNTGESCDRCHGYHKRAFIYTGGPSISQGLADDLARYLPKEIHFYMQMKEFFKNNPEAPYYYKLYDDGEQYTGIRFWNKELEEFRPENVDEEIKKIFDHMEKRRIEQEKFRSFQVVLPVRSALSDSLQIATKSGKQNYIINTAEEQIAYTQHVIDSAVSYSDINRLITYHTWPDSYNSNNGLSKGDLYSITHRLDKKLTTIEQKKIKGYVNYEFDQDRSVALRYLSDGVYIRNDSLNAFKTLLNQNDEPLYYVPGSRQKDKDKIVEWRPITGSKVAVFKTQEGLYGIINVLYNVVVPAKFDAFGSITRSDLVNNLIPAKRRGKWGFIDAAGDTVIKFKFDLPEGQETLKGFHEGSTTVIYKGDLVQIDVHGDVIP